MGVRRGGSIMRFIHTADWQIGMKRHFLDEDAQARFSDARENSIRKIGQVAETHDAAFIVVAGDVFETNLLRSRTILRTLDALREISVPVYLLPGNHDHLGPTSIYKSQEFLHGKPDNVYVLESDDIVMGPEETEVVGVPWAAKRLVEDRVGQRVQQLPTTSGHFRVVVGHGTTAAMGGSDILGVIDLTQVEAAIAQNKLHYLALGDRHSTTPCGDTGRVWYSGAPEPTDYDEVDAGNVLVVELVPGDIRVTRVPIGTWRFVECMLDVEAGNAEAALEHFLAELPDKAHTIVKINFRGTIGILDQMGLERTIAEQRDVFAAIERHEHRDQLAILPASGQFHEVNLTGYAREAFNRLVAGSSYPDPEGQRFRDALALYYRMIREA